MRLKSPKRKVSIKIRREPVVATRKNECWSTDFVSDGLFDGRRLRALTIVDNFTRESPAIRVGCCCRGTDVVEEQEAATKLNGLPKVIKVDKRPRIYLEGARSMGL